MNTRTEGTLGRPLGRLLIFVWAALLLCVPGAKAEPVKTVVQDTLFRANGQVAQGMLTVRWNSFSTSAGEAVPAGELTATIGANGSIAIPLIPNIGSSPSGSYYKVIFKLNDGTASEEQWVVPVATTTTVAEIRAKVVPQAVAAQFASREYVDAALAAVVPASLVHLAGAETITGAKIFAVSPEVPTTPADAGAAVARAYVDEQFAGLAPVATTGDYNDLLNKPTTGATADLTSPGPIGSTEPGSVNATSYSVNGVPLSSANLSDGSVVAKTNQANIFTQPQTMPDSITGKTPAADIRAYGAVCDGSTDDTAALQAAITALGASGGTILVPGRGNGCYVANPTGITWPTFTGSLAIQIQGKLKTGSTIVSPDWVDWIGVGGSLGVQFHGAGLIGQIQGPTASGTLGTGCTANTPCTFTPSAMTGIKTGGALSVAGKSTCTISSIARASNVVTATLSGACHIPAGLNVTIAGVTDTGFNGTFFVNRSDYPAHTLGWAQTAAGASSSGGTAVGYNENSIDTAIITATTSTTATATFAVDHTSADSFGIVGIYLTGYSHHQLKGITISASGVNIWAHSASMIHLDGVSAQSFGPWGALEFNESFWNWINNSSFLNYSGLSSWSIRFTNSNLSSESGSGMAYIDNTVVGGGIKVDRGTGFGQGNIYLKNVTSETTSRGMVTIDNSGTSLQSINIDSSLVQDNFSGVFQCYVSSLYPTTTGAVRVTGVNTAGTNCIANHYYNGGLQIDGVSGNLDVKGAIEGVAQTDLHGVNVIQKGIAEMELRGQQAGFSPALVPHATLPIPQANAWATGGGCTVATGTAAPDGTTNAATLTYSAYPGGYTVYTYSHIPVVGDIILFSAWVKGPVGQLSGGTVLGGSLAVGGGGGTGFEYDGGNGTTSPIVAAEGSGYTIQLANDWWHPIVGAARIAQADGSYHNIGLVAECSTTGISYYNPTMIYIPASEGVEMREIARWRQQLLHGYTPPNAVAGQLGIFPEGKLNWGGDTNLYRGAAGVVKTDGTLNTVSGYQVNGAALNFSHLSGSIAASQLPALTGDVTTSAGTVATTLATVNSNTGTCGDAAHVCQVTLDAKGRTTAATAVALSGGSFDPASPGPIGGTTPNAISATAVTTTTLTPSGKVTIPTGTKTAPLFVINGDSANAGWYSRAAGFWSYTNGSSSLLEIGANTGGSGRAIQIGSNYAIAFGGGDLATTGADVGISRSAAGVLAVGNGSGAGNTTGTLKAGTVEAVTTLKLDGVATGTQCLHADSSGAVSGTGSDCGAGGSTPGGTAGAIQYNTGSALGGAVISGIVKGNGTSAPTAATGSDIPNIAESQVTNLPGDLIGKVATTRTVNGYPLSADVTVTKSDVGLGNADNTSDANKPVSTATQTALDLREPSLGNPDADGKIPSSTAAGVRSWVAPFDPTNPGPLGGTAPDVVNAQQFCLGPAGSNCITSWPNNTNIQPGVGPTGPVVPPEYVGLHVQCSEDINPNPNPLNGNATNKNYNYDCSTSTVTYPSFSYSSFLPTATSYDYMLRLWDDKVKYSQIAYTATQSSWYWDTFNYWIHEAQAHNQEVLYSAGSSTPSWACSAGSGCATGSVPTDTNWTNFLTAIMNHGVDTVDGTTCTIGGTATCRPAVCQNSGTWAGQTKGCLHILEPWNEPNTSGSYTGTMAQMVHLVALAKTVRNNASTANVIVTTPAYTYTGSNVTATGNCANMGTSNSPEDYVCSFLQTTSSTSAEGVGAAQVDAVAFHPYPGTSFLASIAEGTMNNRLNGIKNAMTANGITGCTPGGSTSGCKPIYSTEYSWGFMGNGSSAATNELFTGNCAVSGGCPRIYPGNDVTATAPESTCTADTLTAYPGYGCWASDQAAFVVKTMVLGWTGGASRNAWYWWGAHDVNNGWGTLFCTGTNTGIGCPSADHLQPAGVAYGVVQAWLAGANVSAPVITGTRYEVEITLATGQKGRIVWDSSKGPGQSSSYTYTDGFDQKSDQYGNVTAASSPVTFGYAPILLFSSSIPSSGGITLTTTGTSGPATLVGNALNVPQYSSGSGTVTGVTASAPISSSGGTAPNISLSGTVPVANGGTGQTTQQAAMDALTGTQGSGKYLRSDGTHTTLSTIQAADVPTLNQDTTGTAGGLTGTPNITVGTIGATAITGTGRLINSVAGAVSAPAVSITGAPYTGGTGTTTHPLVYLNSGATAPTTWSTSGTFIGINAPSGYVGNLLDVHVNGGSSVFKVGSDSSLPGSLNVGNGSFIFYTNGQSSLGALNLSSNLASLGNNGLALGSGVRVSFSSTAAYTGTSDTGLSRSAAGVIAVGNGTQGDLTGTIKAGAYATGTNCASAASPAVCGSAAAGMFVIAASATTVTVNTTAVTANSEININNDASIGTPLGVTCNTSMLTAPPQITARTAGTSFTLAIAAGPVVNPECFSYTITN